MSSHHIVRDNQEPALLVLDVAYNSFKVIEELLEWSPFIIVQHSQLDYFLVRDIKVDAVLFKESDRREVSEQVKDQMPVKLLGFQPEESSLKCALAFLHTHRHTSVNVITDDIHLFQELESINYSLNVNVLHSTIRWSLIRSGHFEKWVSGETELLLLYENQTTVLHPDRENTIRVKKPGTFWIGEKLKD
jgi:thiamine pyrophosphokinase